MAAQAAFGCLVAGVLALTSGGCAPKLVGVHEPKPIVLATPDDRNQAFLITSVWDAGWGWFAPVNGPTEMTLQFDPATDEETLRSKAYDPPPDRDLEDITNAAQYLNRLDSPPAARYHFVLSVSPPVFGYVNGRRKLDMADPRRGSSPPFITESNRDVMIDGYVLCKTTVFKAARYRSSQNN